MRKKQRKYKKIIRKMKNFDSGIKISVIVAVVIAFNFLIFVHMFGINIIGFLNPDFEINLKDDSNFELETKIKKMTKGYPIEEMSQYISREDEQVAAFLISIAKKESNWGKRSPKLNGKDCYNYWGFRKKQKKMGTGGHTCFGSPREAVKVVARRIEELIDSGVNDPESMVVWKCGYDCGDHSNESVSKWISDVGLYYEKFYK